MCVGTHVWWLEDNLVCQSLLSTLFETGSLLFVAVCATLAGSKTCVAFSRLHFPSRVGALGLNMHTAVSGFKEAPGI